MLQLQIERENAGETGKGICVVVFLLQRPGIMYRNRKIIYTPSVNLETPIYLTPWLHVFGLWDGTQREPTQTWREHGNFPPRCWKQTFLLFGHRADRCLYLRWIQVNAAFKSCAIWSLVRNNNICCCFLNSLISGNIEWLLEPRQIKVETPAFICKDVMKQS